MSIVSPKAMSVTAQGEPDGWEVQEGYDVQPMPDGSTRLLVSLPAPRLAEGFCAIAPVLGARVGVLYRQYVNRMTPGPNGAQPVDYIALELPLESVLAAVRTASTLLFHDARAELWLRGDLGDQMILDRDGLIYCYPDDPAFRDAVKALELREGAMEVLLERDYVKHFFHSENDVLEQEFIASLGLSRVGQ